MFTEQQINILESVKVPNTYWDKKSYEYQYWWRSLYQKVTSSIVFNNLPDGWNKDFFLWNIFLLGYTCVTQTERFGLIFQPCTVSGFDIYYQPVKALISNPLYNREVILHKDAEIINLTQVDISDITGISHRKPELLCSEACRVYEGYRCRYYQC